MLSALDSDADAWRAIQVAGHLPQVADELVPRLCDHLRRIDLFRQQTEMSTNAILSALAVLGDPAAVAVVVDTFGAAVRLGQHDITQSALKALGVFGPAAAGAQDSIRSLTTAADAQIRPAAVAALWAVGGDLSEVMPLLLHLLDGRITFHIGDAAGLLGEIGPPASVALPLLRNLLTHDCEWVRVHCAAALWEIGGEAEAPAVLDALLQAMAKNPATANRVVTCLDRMGSLAVPALPLLREQLALPRRGGRFRSIDHDEELQRVGRTLVARLATPDECAALSPTPSSDTAAGETCPFPGFLSRRPARCCWSARATRMAVLCGAGSSMRSGPAGKTTGSSSGTGGRGCVWSRAADGIICVGETSWFLFALVVPCCRSWSWWVSRWCTAGGGLVEVAVVAGCGVRVPSARLGEFLVGLLGGALAFDGLVCGMDGCGMYRGDGGRPAFPAPATPTRRFFPSLPSAAAALLVCTCFDGEAGWQVLLGELGGTDADGWAGADLDPDEIEWSARR